MAKKDDIIYQRWTDLTYSCYMRGCRCKGCKNYFDCKDVSPVNGYNMPNVKYAVLKIFANKGREGLEEYRGKR